MDSFRNSLQWLVDFSVATIVVFFLFWFISVALFLFQFLILMVVDHKLLAFFLILIINFNSFKKGKQMRRWRDQRDYYKFKDTFIYFFDIFNMDVCVKIWNFWFSNLAINNGATAYSLQQLLSLGTVAKATPSQV